ncbi:DUF6122 family protein [Pseudomonas sp. HK3]
MLEPVLSFIDQQRAIIHLFLHALVPLVVAYWCAPSHRWKAVLMIMIATMAVDVDHLLAAPIYAPNRCSILFHPLHQLAPIAVYALMAAWPWIKRGLKQKVKPVESVVGWVGIGLLIHMLLDGLDCWWMKEL